MQVQQQKQARDLKTNAIKPLYQESPQIFKERQSAGSEFNQISPIPTLSCATSSPGFQSQNTLEKGQVDKLGGTQKMRTIMHQNYYQGGEPQSNNFMDMDSPNSLVKDFYRQELSNQMNGAGNGRIFVRKDEGDNNDNRAVEGTEQLGYNSIKHQDYTSGLYSSSSGQIGQSVSQGKSLSKQPIRDFKQQQLTCTDFDLTAKEISSNKRGLGVAQEKVKNTIISGRTSHSPIDGPPSNSETVKWAFSNRDSQETQKKISIINRESLNAQELISRSLKSHDSKGGQSSQGQNSSNQNLPLKGKTLDFASIEPTKQQIESGLFYSNNTKEQIAAYQLSSQTFESNMVSNNEEGKMISFLEDETEMLIASQKKQLFAKNSGGMKLTHFKFSKNQKCLTKHRHEVKEPLFGLVDNSMECQLCNKQKIYDSSLNCSKIEEPKGYHEIIKQNLEKKYLTSREYYNVKIINDIIYNEQTHIVSVFKDYLIYDDISEFLKRFYYRLESVQRLPKMFEFYEKYSKVFANYVILPENKYLFKNIEKKQRLIDEKQRIIQEQQDKKLQKQNGINTSGDEGAKKNNRHKDRFSSQNQNNSSNVSEFSTNRMFDTKFIDSVNNIKASGFIEASSMMSSRINNSQYQDHLLNCSIMVHQQLQQNMEKAAAAKKKTKRRIADLDFGELISKFIAKDSQSQIGQSSSSLMLSTVIVDNEPLSNKDNQENLKEQKKTPVQLPHRQDENMISSTNPTQKKPQVYEYQEKKGMPLQPSSVAKSDNSKNASDNNVSQGRSNSTNKQADQNQKRLSSGGVSQKSQPSSTTNLKQQDKQGSAPELTKDGKIMNYNIYNNYNLFNGTTQGQDPNINNLIQDPQRDLGQNINICYNQFINNENYYIAKNPPDDNAILPAVDDPKSPSFLVQPVPQQTTSRGSSLQRNQSRSNLHTMAQQQQISIKSNIQGENCQTPIRAAKLMNEPLEKKTPGSGKTGLFPLQKSEANSNEQQDKTKYQRIIKLVPTVDSKSNFPVASSDTQRTPQMNQLPMRPTSQVQIIRPLSDQRTASPAALTQRDTNSEDALGLGQLRGNLQGLSQNQVVAQPSIIQRDLSKDRKAIQKQQQVQSNQVLAQQFNSVGNQMFKNEVTSNSISARVQSDQVTSQYNSQPREAPGSQNVRSVERLKSIEEEIEKDYSKYVNEYGLTKTAFAKAVNALREKQQQVPQNFQPQKPANIQQQQQHQYPITSRQAVRVQNSNEKKRTGSNNVRSGSTSQTRKQSQNRQQQSKLGGQESANEYQNRNEHKQIRSVRAKINSQNSSCYNQHQRSTKLSPDKALLNSGSQFLSNQNLLGLTQNINTGQNSTSNYITLKAQQASKQAKGIKIKFPLSTNRVTSQNKNQNTSQNQTPKRMKLQKTKSTSNIQGFVSQRTGNTGGMVAPQRGRIQGGAPDVMIYDEMSQHMNVTNPIHNFNHQSGIRSPNDQHVYQVPQSNQMANDNQHYHQQNMLQQQNTFSNSSCGGTYTTTSILNSPLSFKNQGANHQYLATSRQQQPPKSQSKGRQSNSRNGGNSQHQSQKSISHQRATSNSNILQTSSNKPKNIKNDLTATLSAADYKRLSAGSNLSKMSINSLLQQQPTSGTMQHQILQLLMSYQTQNQQQLQQHQQQQQHSDGVETSTYNTGSINPPLSYTLKKLQANSNSSSMKDLKSLNKQGSMINDTNVLKAQKNSNNLQGSMVNSQQPNALNTQRQGGYGAQNILMINQKKAGGKSSSTKNTARVSEGGSKKRQSMPYQLQEYPQNTTQFSNNGQQDITTHGLSNRINAVINSNYGISTDLSTTHLDPSQMMNQNHQKSGLLSYSKSTENFELIKFAAQRALENQQNQTGVSQLIQQHQQQNQTNSNKSSFNFLQNLKQQQENHPQISLSKIKLMPSSASTYQLQQPVQQSARNAHYEAAQNFKSSNSGSDEIQLMNSRGPTNIIIGPSNFEKPSSRRTSGKFNPSSTKSGNQ